MRGITGGSSPAANEPESSLNPHPIRKMAVGGTIPRDVTPIGVWRPGSRMERTRRESHGCTRADLASTPGLVEAAFTIGAWSIWLKCWQAYWVS